VIDVRNASVEFAGTIPPEDAEEIVSEALRLAAGRLPGLHGVTQSVSLPSVEIAAGMDVGAAAEALADALVRGITAARREPHA
jgi:hypothetical protein